MRRFLTLRWIKLTAKVTLGLLLSAHVAIAAQGCLAHGMAPFAGNASPDAEVTECHGPFSQQRQLCFGRCLQLQRAVGIMYDHTAAVTTAQTTVNPLPTAVLIGKPLPLLLVPPYLGPPPRLLFGNLRI